MSSEMEIILLSEGQQVVSCGKPEQVAQAQKPWILVYAEFLASQGIDPTKQKIVFYNRKQVHIFKTCRVGRQVYDFFMTPLP